MSGAGSGADVLAPDVHRLESWLPNDAVREPLFATNAAKLYRFEN